MADAPPPPLQIEAQPMVASLVFNTLYKAPIYKRAAVRETHHITE
jgi:hypothetical protein